MADLDPSVNAGNKEIPGVKRVAEEASTSGDNNTKKARQNTGDSCEDKSVEELQRELAAKDKIIKELTKVEDLQRELAAKDKVIENLTKVQVTGHGGTPVYAEAQFGSGFYDDTISDWKVDTTTLQNCPFKKVRGLEVRVGGIVRFTFYPRINGLHSIVSYKAGDKEDQTDAIIENQSDLKMVLSIAGLTGTGDRYCGLTPRNSVYGRPSKISVYPFLEGLPYVNDISVRFNAIVFHVPKFQSLIDNVPLTNEQKQRKQELITLHDKERAMKARLSAEISPIGGAVRLLFDFIWNYLQIREVNDELELILPPLTTAYRQDRRISPNDESLINSWMALFCDYGQPNYGQPIAKDDIERKQMLQSFASQLKSWNEGRARILANLHWL